MKTPPREFTRRNGWRQWLVTFTAIVALLQSAVGGTDQESPPLAPLVNYATEPFTFAAQGVVEGEVVATLRPPVPKDSASFALTWSREPYSEDLLRMFNWNIVGLRASYVVQYKLQPLFAHPRVNEATGELFVEYLDLVIPGRGLDLVWARTYRSKIGIDTPMGVNWDFSYNIRAAQSGSNITVQDGQNRIDTYFLQGDGSYSTDELFRRGTLSGNVFTLQFADKTNWIFKPLDGSPISGKIDKIIDRNGNQIQFQYDGTGRLFLIIDSLNRPFQISYDGANRVQAVQDFTGRTIQYQHLTSVVPGQGGIGDLVSVRSQAVTGTPTGNDFPNGKVAQFTYSTQLGGARDHNLLTARDGLNLQWFRAVYTTTAVTTDFLYDRVASEIVGTAAETKVFTYLVKLSPNSRFNMATKTIVNDAIGNVHESLFDSKNRLIDLRQFTGRSTPGVPVTETTNRPINPVRPSDPAFYETTIDWNRDSLPTRIIFPRGNGVEMVYQRDSAAATNPRERANLSVYRQLPVTGAPLITRFEYQPGFGTGEFRGNNFEYPGTSCEFRPGKLARTDYNFEKPITDLLTGVRPGGASYVDPNDDMTLWATYYGTPCDPWDGDVHVSYWRARTDARGFTWRCARDGNGNATSVTRPDGVITDIEHNANGQLTAIVRPPNHTGHRERDEWHYYNSGSQNGYLQSFIRDAGGLNLTTAFTHNSVGCVTQIVDPRGRDAQFFVNQLNQIVQVTSRDAGTSGRYLTNIYRDANNRITHVDVQNKNEFGNVGSPPFFVTSFLYDSLDHVTSMTRTVDNAHTITTQYFYNPIRELIEMRSPLAVGGVEPDARVQYAYDERDLPFTRTAAPGSGIATGSTYTYDRNGHLSKLESGAPAGPQHTTIWSYDGFDRLTTMTNPVGTITQYGYNANHQVTSFTVQGNFLDANGNPTFGPLRGGAFVYDANSILAQRIDSWFDPITTATIGDGARTTTIARDPTLNLISLTDDNGHATSFSYDGANRLSRVTDPKGNLVEHTYDANGNLVTRTQTDKSDTAAPDQVFVLTNVYDGLDRLITSTDNVGNVRSYFYNSRSNRVRYIDPRNKLTQSQYDGLNRLLRSGRDMNGNNSGFDAGIDIISARTWDDNSRLIGATNPNSYSTQYQYDAIGRCLQRSNADTTAKTWSYDAWGNAIQSHDENATVCINNYDNLNRLRQRQIIPGPGVSNATTFEIYDFPGEYSWPERAINNAAVARYTFDSLAHTTGERLGNQITSYTIDTVGNLLTLQSPGGRVLSYAHDSANLCTNINLTATSDGDTLGQMVAYNYVGRRVESAVHRNGTSTTYTYDGYIGAPPGSDLGWGKLAASESHGPGNAVIDQRTCTYDANQNLSDREDTRVGGPQLLHHYDYDPANRNNHTQVTAPGPNLVRDTIYNYDLNGNRIAVNGFNTPDPGPYFQDNAIPPADAQMNQYTSTPRGGYLYDANGNRMNLNGGGANTNNTYDYANRLIDLTNATTSVRIANYQYDAVGRRIQKTLDPDGTPNVTNFVYTGLTVLEERDGGGAVNAAYTLIVDGIATKPVQIAFQSLAPGIGPGDEGCDDGPRDYSSNLTRSMDTGETWGCIRSMDPCYPCGWYSLAPVEIRRGGTNYTYPVRIVNPFALDKIYLLTNSGGTAAERYDYEDFGDPHIFDGSGNPLPSSAIGNPYLFKGMRFDGESGLYLSAPTGIGEDIERWSSFTMFDPKIGASLQRESNHAVNANFDISGGLMFFGLGDAIALLWSWLQEKLAEGIWVPVDPCLDPDGPQKWLPPPPPYDKTLGPAGSDADKPGQEGAYVKG